MVEQSAVNRSVVGSSPTFGATFPKENDKTGQSPKDCLNKSLTEHDDCREMVQDAQADLKAQGIKNPTHKEVAQHIYDNHGVTVGEQGVARYRGGKVVAAAVEDERTMKFPRRLKYRNRVLATIYGKTARKPSYQLYWRVDGKTRIREFRTYAEAKCEGDKLVTELAKGSRVTALSPAQASDALAAFERLDTFYQSTGRRVSLRAGIAEFCEAAGKVNGQSLGEVVDRFLATVAVVQRKAVGEAVAEFVTSRKHLAEVKDGKRSKHSPVYERHVATWLREFANTFPGYAVCDLTKELLNAHLGKFEELSAKSRNDRRAVAKMFLRWCGQKDYLPQNHRLFEAVDFKLEDADTAEIDYYRPNELRNMLDAAEATVLPVIALGGLAGLRREEITRLEWADVWRVKGKVEISAKIAKGRKRRLVTICPALAAWLRPYRHSTGLVWNSNTTALEAGLRTTREAAEVPSRRNGLRHAFVTYHFAK